MVTDDQQLIEALPADRPDPALSDGVRVGRLHWCADHLGSGRAPHAVDTLVNLVSRSRIRNLHATA
jgi:hypothetical protein